MDNLARAHDYSYTGAKKVAIKKAKKKPQGRFGMMIMVCAAFALAMLMIVRFSAINEMQKNVADQKEVLHQLQSDNRQMQLKLEQTLELKKVEEVATNRLGMVKPAKDQIITIDVGAQDVCQILKTEESGRIFSFLMQD